MKVSNLPEILGNTDIYLLDQIIKGRYQPQETILDAGCGSGRNMHWFYNNGFNLIAIDSDQEKIDLVKSIYPNQSDNFQVASLTNLPYHDNFIDHIICSAVLHFAENKEHFTAMFTELARVLKPQGSLFIRMTAIVGVESTITQLGDGVYRLKDETKRFLLTRELLDSLMKDLNLEFLEPFKTTLVEDLRSMSIIMLGKC